MEIRYLWPTPVAQKMVFLDEPVRRDLISVLLRKDVERHKIGITSPEFEAFMTSKRFYASSHYNLFAEADTHPEHAAIKTFERLAYDLFRDYLHRAFDIGNEQTVEVAGRCFGNVQASGDRTFPHYHQSCDAVLVHYLDVGDGEPEPPSTTARRGTHALLLLDPRGAPNFPWWEKVSSITPHRGLTIIHPAHVWHETNVWRGEGSRVCIVVNFQVLKPGYLDLHRRIPAP